MRYLTRGVLAVLAIAGYVLAGTMQPPVSRRPVHDMKRDHGYYAVSKRCQWEYGHGPGQASRWSVVCR